MTSYRSPSEKGYTSYLDPTKLTVKPTVVVEVWILGGMGTQNYKRGYTFENSSG